MGLLSSAFRISFFLWAMNNGPMTFHQVDSSAHPSHTFSGAQYRESMCSLGVTAFILRATEDGMKAGCIRRKVHCDTQTQAEFIPGTEGGVWVTHYYCNRNHCQNAYPRFTTLAQQLGLEGRHGHDLVLLLQGLCVTSRALVLKFSSCSYWTVSELCSSDAMTQYLCHWHVFL